MNTKTKLLNCFIYYSFLFQLVACKPDNSALLHAKKYEGPLIQATNVHTLFSDSAVIKVELKAPLQYEYENGDRVFPKGVIIYFLNPNGSINNSLKANHGKFYKATGIYTGTGDVLIRDSVANKKMNTEKLHWNPTSKKVYTDKFVRIETASEVLTGNGLDASQDFKYYKIKNPTGIFSLSQ